MQCYSTVGCFATVRSKQTLVERVGKDERLAMRSKRATKTHGGVINRNVNTSTLIYGAPTIRLGRGGINKYSSFGGRYTTFPCVERKFKFLKEIGAARTKGNI